MIFAIILLLLVIIISLMFKYYIFKYRIFKEKLLEGLDSNTNFEAVNTIPIIDTVADDGAQIYNLDDQILKLKDSLSQGNEIKSQKDQTYNQLSGNLSVIQSEYNSLNAEYNKLLEDKKNEIKLQSSSLHQGIIEQTNVKNEISAEDDAEKKTTTIKENAYDFFKKTESALNSSIIAIENGNINGAITANNNAQSAYNAILNSKTDMENNVIKCKSTETAIKNQGQFGTYMGDARKNTEGVALTIPIATAVNKMLIASTNSLTSFSKLSSARVSAKNAKTSNEAHGYVNIAQAEYNNIGNDVQIFVDNINVLNNIDRIITPKFSNQNDPNRLFTEIKARYSDAKQILDAAISAEEITKAQEEAARIAEENARQARLKEEARKSAIYAALHNFVASDNIIIYYDFNTANNNMVMNQVTQNYDLNMENNIHAISNIDNNLKIIGSGSLDCKGNENYGGFATVINQSYNFSNGFTIMFWMSFSNLFKFDDNGGFHTSGIFWACNSENKNMDISIRLTNQNSYYFLANATITLSLGGVDHTNDTKLNANTWYHVAIGVTAGGWGIVIDGTNVVDGAANNILPPKPVDTIYVGASWSNGVNYGAFKSGHIDEFIVYNRALTRDECNQMYNYYNITTNKKIKLFF